MLKQSQTDALAKTIDYNENKVQINGWESTSQYSG